MGKRFVCICLLSLLLIGLSVPVQAAPVVSARSAIVIDALTGKTLYEKDADRTALIASTTKIMTGLLVCERCDLSQTVTVPAQACGIEGSSLHLKQGERISVRGLLYGMLLHSGNDAATALAIWTCGTEDAFVAAMNCRAAELGLVNTCFANPHGLDSGDNYSTARDLAHLAAVALKNDIFSQVAATKTLRTDGRSLTNHNKMLWLYEGADGVKTGYTKAAGRILVSSATRHGRQLICVTLDAPADWQDHSLLLDYGFGQLQPRRVIRAGECLATVPCLDCGQNAALVAARDCTVYLLPGEQASRYLLAPRFLFGPVESTQTAAAVQIRIDGKVLAVCALVAQESG